MPSSLLEPQNQPCLFLGLTDNPDLPGPRHTCQHGVTLHINLARRALKLESYTIEELAEIIISRRLHELEVAYAKEARKNVKGKSKKKRAK